MVKESIAGLSLLALSLVMSAANLSAEKPDMGECSICEIKEPVIMEIRCVHGKTCGVMIMPKPEEKKKKK